MLAVRGLRLTYPGAEQPALDGVDVDVAAGEVVTVLGPSGCGKSTLLRVVAGLVEPDAGTVAVDGHDLAGVAPHRRHLGLMFQDYALFPHRDVGDNVAFGLRMQGEPAPRRNARVAELLELVGLAGAEHRSVATLSGGERQRVALARALAPNPALLMLDEPLGALDRTLRDRLVHDLGALFAELGLAVLYVTHDQSEALALGHRVVIMEAGRVVQTGSPLEVWARPATRFVAEFLGFENLVDAEGATVVIRPEAVQLDPADERAGDRVGEVVESSFDAGRWRVQVVVDGTVLVTEVAGLPAPPTGRVRVRIDPAATVTIPDTPHAPDPPELA